VSALRSTVAGLLLLLGGGTLTAQEAPVVYRVGPGDVLEVTVVGRPDLSRMPTVQPTGSVWLPIAGEVAVEGSTREEIAARVASRLKESGVASPDVRVKVAEYESQFVWVRGAVVRPGRKPLRSGTRLVDALLDAGGFVQGASGDVTIERAMGTFEGGSSVMHLHFTGTSPSPEELRALELPLEAGDVITAAVQRWVSVEGAVARPGRYPLDEGLTVEGLLKEAGGTLRAASERVILRHEGVETEVDLKAIRNGEAADVVLAPGDVVTVRARRL
jgi:polysaccharide export outer membrane protein